MPRRRVSDSPPNDIEAALDDLEIDWRASGSNEAAAFCPHPDHLNTRTPAWSINLESGLHECKSCGYKGNWLTLVRTVTGLGTAEATRWTRDRQSIGARGRVSETISAGRRKREAPEMSESDLWPFSEDIPRRYLRKRMLTAEAAAEYGVLWDAEQEAWIIPIRDPDTGSLMGWQEKAERDRVFRNTPPGVQKSRTLFGLGSAEASRTAILVEAPLDTVRFRTAGIRGSVSSWGVRVSDRQKYLLRSRFDCVLLALDNDSEGLAATAQLSAELPRVRRFDYQGFTTEERKDPGEMTDDELWAGIDGATGALGGWHPREREEGPRHAHRSARRAGRRDRH